MENQKNNTNNSAAPNNEDESGIKINFNPQIPGTEDKSKTDTLPANLSSKADTKAEPEIIKLNLNKDEMKKDMAAGASLSAAPGAAGVLTAIKASPKEAKPAKKGLFSKLFAKKPAITKPSTAWDQDMDIDIKDKPKPGAIKTEVKPVAAQIPTQVGNKEKPTATSTTPAPEKKEESFFMGTKPEAKASSSQILESIASQKSKLETPKSEKLLGKAGSAILEKSIEEERLNKLKKKLRVRKMLTVLVLLLAIGVNGYYFYQLSPSLSVIGINLFNFDNNLFANANQTNDNLLAVQTNINKYRFLTGELYLNQFSFDMIRFFDLVDQLGNPSTVNARGDIENQLATLKQDAPNLLTNAKANLSQDISTPLIELPQSQSDVVLDPKLQFQGALRDAVNQEKSQLLSTSQSSGVTEALQREIDFLDNTSALIGNATVLNALNAVSPDQLSKDMDDYQNLADPAQRQKFKTEMMDIIGSTKNPLATISNLKSQKIDWTNEINNIVLITKKVNTEHNSGTVSNSNISFNSFDLNGTDKKISFSGISKTADGTNREVVTFLIEALESSPYFKNVNNRTFPLSKETDPATGKETYSMNFRIDLELENNGFDVSNAPLVSFAQNLIGNIKN